MRHISRHVLFATAAVAAAGCERPTVPVARVPVAFHVVVSGPSLSANRVAAATVSGLEITTVRLGIGVASLGTNGQYGCVDCQGDTSDGPSPGALVDIPMSGAPVRVVTEQVSPGVYGEVEFTLRTLAPGQWPSATWSATTTIEITGRFGGSPFTITLPVAGMFRQTLKTPLHVVAGAAPGALDVTITLPVASWFEAGGVLVDPNVATSRAVIEANIRRAFLGVEATEAEAPEPGR